MQQLSQRGDGLIQGGAYRRGVHAPSTLYVNAFQLRIENVLFEARVTKSHIDALELRYGIFNGGNLYITHRMPDVPPIVKFGTRKFEELAQGLQNLGYKVDIIKVGIFNAWGARAKS